MGSVLFWYLPIWNGLDQLDILRMCSIQVSNRVHRRFTVDTGRNETSNNIFPHDRSSYGDCVSATISCKFMGSIDRLRNFCRKQYAPHWLIQRDETDFHQKSEWITSSKVGELGGQGLKPRPDNSLSVLTFRPISIITWRPSVLARKSKLCNQVLGKEKLWEVFTAQTDVTGDDWEKPNNSWDEGQTSN